MTLSAFKTKLLEKIIQNLNQISLKYMFHTAITPTIKSQLSQEVESYLRSILGSNWDMVWTNDHLIVKLMLGGKVKITVII